MRKALATTYTIAVVVVGLIGLLFVATLMPIPGNVKVKVVKSGSMEPAVHVGSIVVIKPATSYKVGDIVTFGEDTQTKIPTTHRIVKVSGEGANMTFTTKGDANDSEDNTTVHLQDIRGKMLFTVPYLGYALAFARTKLGFFLLVGVLALAVFLEEGRSIYRELKRRRRRMRVVEAEEPAERHQEPPQNRRKVMGALGLFVGLSLVGGAGYFGNTLAYYANTATSAGNTMRAGVFDVPQKVIAPLALLFEVVVGEPVVSEPEPIVEEETKAEEPPADETPLEVEVSTSEAVIE